MEQEKLGRLAAFDARDTRYMAAAIVPTAAPSITSKYWNANGWWGNQGTTYQCVGFSWAHWVEDGPVGHDGVPPIIKPEDIYREAQKIDEWVGEAYDGTSVRAGV